MFLIPFVATGLRDSGLEGESRAAFASTVARWRKFCILCASVSLTAWETRGVALVYVAKANVVTEMGFGGISESLSPPFLTCNSRFVLCKPAPARGSCVAPCSAGLQSVCLSSPSPENVRLKLAPLIKSSKNKQFCTLITQFWPCSA